MKVAAQYSRKNPKGHRCGTGAASAYRFARRMPIVGEFRRKAGGSADLQGFGRFPASAAGPAERHGSRRQEHEGRGRATMSFAPASISPLWGESIFTILANSAEG
jgi:hypothetical protein